MDFSCQLFWESDVYDPCGVRVCFLLRGSVFLIESFFSKKIEDDEYFITSLCVSSSSLGPKSGNLVWKYWGTMGKLLLEPTSEHNTNYKGPRNSPEPKILLLPGSQHQEDYMPPTDFRGLFQALLDLILSLISGSFLLFLRLSLCSWQLVVAE